MATRRVVIQFTTQGGRETERAIRRTGDAATGAQKAVNGFRNVLVALAAVSAAKGLVEYLDTITRIDNRLNLLTRSQTLTNKLFNDLAVSARQTRSSLEVTANLFSRLQRSTADLGLSQTELLDLTTGINQAFQIYGATAAEASSATVQFAQGLAAGAVRGDELRSVLEQGPRLARALAEGLTEIEAFGPGVRTTIGDLRDLGKEGKLTADLVTEALQSQLDTLRKEFAQTTPTITNAFVLLQNEFLIALREIDQGTGVIGDFTQAIITLADNIDRVINFIIRTIESFAAFGQEAAKLVSSIDAVTGGAASATLAIGAITIGLVSILGPVGATIAAITALAGVLNGGLVAATELEIKSKELADAIDAERAATDALTVSLDEGSIISEETARLKIGEAQGRLENVKAIEEERRAQVKLLETQLAANLERARDLQQQARGPLPFIPSVTGLGANLELIGLERQTRPLLESLRRLREQGGQTDEELAQITDNIERLQGLLSSGTLDRAASAEDSDLQKELEKGAEALDLLNKELDRLPRGADGLQELESAQDRINKLFDKGQITLAQFNQTSERLTQLTGTAQRQAVSDLADEFARERDLLGETNAEQEVRNALKSVGLTIETAPQEQLERLREEARLLEEANKQLEEREERENRLKNLEREITDGRTELIQKEKDLIALRQQNRLTLDQFNEAIRENRIELATARSEAGDGDFTDRTIVALDQLRGNFTNLANESAVLFGRIGQSISQGVGDSLAEAIVDGKDLNESLKAVARDGIKQLISGLVNLGVQFLAQQAIAATVGKAAVAQNAGNAATLAAQYATPAALASLSSFGANAVPAAAALASTTALAQGLAAASGALQLADGGMVNGRGGPRDDANMAFLSNGEFVVNAAATRQNRALLEAINSGRFQSGPQQAGGNRTVNLNLPNATDADSFQRSRRQIRRELRNDLGGI